MRGWSFGFRRLLMGVALGGFIGALAIAPSTSAQAQAIPYPTPGTPNAAMPTFVAASSGNVIAYFAGSTASFTESLGLLVNGVDTGVRGLNNQTSAIGDTLNLGFAPAGAILTFLIDVQNTSATYYSNQLLNSDGINRAYATSFAGGTILGSNSSTVLPAGTYVSFEDFPMGGDFNYRDLAFVFPTAQIVAVPGPVAGAGLIPLVGLAGGWLLRRRRKALAV